MHLSKLRVGMRELKMSRIAHPIAEFLLFGGVERDPPRATTIESARFDDVAFDPVIDDVCADREAICKLTHREFFRPLKRD